MNLTPEDRATGKENFFAAIGSPLVRRGFLEQQIRQGLASKQGLGAYYFGYGPTVPEPLRVGVIGTGDEGCVLIGAINPQFIQVKAIADIRPYNLHRAFHGDHYSPTARRVRPGLLEVYGWSSESQAKENVKVYGDYRELIANAAADGLEAVIIALPLHLHAPAAIAAMRAGLHVLTEKLMGHSVRECKEMARAARETGLYLATGHQRHYNILYDNALELVRKGVLGELHYIRAQWHRGNLPGNDSWQKPMPRAIKPDDPLARKLLDNLGSWRERLKAVEKKLEQATSEGEIKKWQAEVAKYRALVDQVKAQIADEVLKDTAEQYGYESKEIRDAEGKVVYHRPAAEELIRWRLWDRTGGGLMAELGSHQLDAASLFIAAANEGPKQLPISVVSSACRPLFPPDRDVEDHVYCIFEFPAPGYWDETHTQPAKPESKVGVQYASINGNGFGGYGETVLGTQGTLILETELEAMLFRTSATDQKIKLVRTSQGIRLEEAPDGDEASAAVGRLASVEVERGYAEQAEHWAWCIRNPAPENQPRCHPQVALTDAVIALTSNLAARREERIEFNPAWFDPESDETPEGEKPDLGRYGA